MLGARLALDVVVELLGVFVFAEFGKRFGFNLTNAFAGNGKFLAHFFKGVALAIFQAEAKLDDLLLALGK